MSRSAPWAPSNKIRLPCLLLFVQHLPDRCRVFQDLRRDLVQSYASSASRSTRVEPKTPAQRVMVDQQPVDPRFQRRGIGQIGHADRRGGRPCLRRPGRCRARSCRSWPRLFCVLARAVQLAVDRQDQRRVFGDHQRLGRDRHALRTDRLDLFQQMPGVQNDAIADDRQACRRARRPKAARAA